MLTSAALAAANISYTSQAEIFGAGSPEIAGLVRLGAMGLGGADTIAQNVKSAVRGVWEDKVLAAWDVTRAERLPVCLLADESTAKTDNRRSWVQLHIFHALLPEPVPWDVFIMHGRATGENIAKALKASMMEEGMIAADWFDAYVCLGATDHASAMLNACERLGVTAAGDGPHAVELVVKALLRKLGLRPFLMKLRKLFTRKNSTAHQRLLEALGIPSTLFNMCVIYQVRLMRLILHISYLLPFYRSVTRWNYWYRMLAALSKPEMWARLQQLLAYLLQELPAAQPAAEAVIVEDVDNGEVDGRDEWDEDDSNDLEFYDDSGISPAVRLQRLQTRRSMLESSVELMLDSAVHSLVGGADTK